MRKILLSIALVASGLLNAQTVVFSDDFNDDDISDWTITDVDGDEKNWEAGGAFDGPGFDNFIKVMRSASWDSGSLTPNNWSISPMIDLSTATGTVTLKWDDLASSTAFEGDKYGVYVATSNSIATLEASATNYVGTNTGSEYLTERTLDLTPFIGQNIYIGFRHFDSEGLDYISIDNVEVSYGATASVKDITAKDVNITYNQYTNKLLVSTNNLTISETIIYSISGKEVQKDNTGSKEVVLNAFNSGVYIVKVVTNKGVISKKIIL